jgi:hypothetical protein
LPGTTRLYNNLLTLSPRNTPTKFFHSFKPNLGHPPLFLVLENEDQVLYVNRIEKLYPGHPFIVTLNMKDFPQDKIEAKVCTPSDFLTHR